MGYLNEDGVTPADGHFYFSPHGLHKVDFDNPNPADSHAGIQAQKLGSSPALQNARNQITGDTPNVSTTHRDVSQQSGLHFGQPNTGLGMAQGQLSGSAVEKPFDALQQAGRKAGKTAGFHLGQLGLGALEAFGGKAGTKLAGGIESAFTQKSLDNFTAVELLSLHVAIQKAQEKEKVLV